MNFDHIEKLQARKWRGSNRALRQRINLSRNVINHQISDIKQAVNQGRLGQNNRFVDANVVAHTLVQLVHLSNLQESVRDVYLVKNQGIARLLCHDFDDEKFQYGDYLQEHLIDTVLGQCLIDVHAILQAFEQRRNMGTSEYDDRQARILYEADIVARQAMQPAIDSGYFDDVPTIITYFDVGTTARTLPYYNAMLMSVPLQTKDIRYAREFGHLPIPHEIGHLMYWQGRVSNQSGSVQPIHQALKDHLNFAKDDWRLAWLEELFADFYGCKIVGPAIVLGFQEALSDDSRSQFIQNPEKHPIAALRPLIQTEMLRIVSPESKDILDILDARWRTIIEHRGGQSDILAQTYPDLGLTGQQIMDGVREVLQVMRTLFSDLNSEQRWWNEASLNPDDSDIFRFSDTRAFDRYFRNLADENGNFQEADLTLFAAFKTYLLTKAKYFSPAPEPHLYTKDEKISINNPYLERWQTLVELWKKTPKQSKAINIDHYQDLIFVAGWSTGGGTPTDSGGTGD